MLVVLSLVLLLDLILLMVLLLCFVDGAAVGVGDGAAVGVLVDGAAVGVVDGAAVVFLALTALPDPLSSLMVLQLLLSSPL